MLSADTEGEGQGAGEKQGKTEAAEFQSAAATCCCTVE